ncbi:MAG: chorismate mutase, partial [Candidatus Eisenbacteria bacterium]
KPSLATRREAMSRPTIAAVRGAISVPADRADAIREASARLLQTLIDRNALTPERVVSAVFTATPDLTADFPAHAARMLGWHDVPLLGATEMAVPGAPPRIVRVLLTVRDVPSGTRLTPVYLDDAVRLRPDLATPTARTAATKPVRIAIVGLGQIGGSLGLALGRDRGWHRVGFDARVTARRAAMQAGAIDEMVATLQAACAQADLVVLATPVDTLPAIIANAASSMPRGAVLLDTASARGGVTQALRSAARSHAVRVCGGHPIAGNSGRGFAAARAALFHGASFALLPVGRGVPQVVRRLVRAVGSHPLVVDAKTHDRALARTSHLPYVLAVALARVGDAAHRQGLSGPGYASMTRLAASDPRMARAYVNANASQVSAAWRELRGVVETELRAQLSSRAAPRSGSPSGRRHTRRATGGAQRP